MYGMTRDGLFRFGGEFRDSAREATFREARFGETLRQCRLIFLISAVLNTLFLASDWRFHGTPHFFVAVPARLMVVFVSLLCFALVRKAARFSQAQAVLIGWEVATALMVALLVSSRSDLALFVVLMLPSIFYLVAPTSFRWTLVLGLGCSALMLVGYLGREPTPSTLPGLILVLIMLNFALGLVVVHGNRLRRLEWAATQAERQAKDELGASQAMIERIFMAVPIPLVVTSRGEGRFLRGNDAARRYFGDEITQAQVRDVLLDGGNRRVIAQLLDDHDQIEGHEAQVRDSSGAVRDVLITATTLPIGENPAVVAGIVDITDRKAAEARTRRQATHDALTGLPNRLLFNERMQQALARMASKGGAVGLFLIDLDDFKSINDTLGHAAGDDLLRLVADRMPDVLRAEDTACRMGGDEFAFLLEGADRERGEEVANRILAALADPFEVAGRPVTLSASIGIATRAGAVDGARAGEVADEVLRDADTAMYAAKAAGKAQIQVFERGMNEPIARRRELHNSLDRAIDGDELFLEYQPIVDMRDRSVVGVEALVRWNHPQLGRLAPGEFIGLAEQSGLIQRLGEFVLRRACIEMADRRMLLSVNVSAHQLASGTLPGLVGEIIATTGFPASRLMLELTESTLTSAGAGAEAELQAMRQLGVKLALDDFGSGYSSLEYLGRLPVDVLKIDRSLVERAHEDRQRQEVLRAVAHIASKLGLTTIVEGVELEAQRVTLLELGFRQAQGFLFAAPMPLPDAVRPLVRPLAS